MASRIALYGGSFNPIHHGHLIVARCVAEALRLDRVIFLPSANPPHKDSSSLLDASRRADMVKLAIDGEAGFEFSDHDLANEGPSYTVETVAHFVGALSGDVDLHWIIGADSLAELASWHRVSDLADTCCLVTAARPGWDATALDALQSALSADQIERLRNRVLQTPRIDISATDIRERIRAGRSVRYLVPDPVRSYIEDNELYRAKRCASGRR